MAAITALTNRSSAVERGLAYLAAAQLPTGQFPMEFTLRDPSGVLVTSPEKSPFCTSYIASSLSNCEDPRATEMVERALDFLEREKVRGGLWRYWCKDAPLHYQIPPDVDDTSCISGLLRRFRGRSPDNSALLLANRNQAGLFYTWMIPRLNASLSARWWWTVLTDMTYGRAVTFWRAGARRDDVDSVVNANVLMYLGERKETDAVIDWLLEVAQLGLEERSDKWYRSRAAFYLAVARCRESGIERLGALGETMVRSFSLVTDEDGRIGSDALQTAMALCAVMHMGLAAQPYRKSFEFLIDSQQHDGGWDSFPIYYDGRAIPLISWGSRSVTTGFCLEALSRWTGLTKA